ncbi:NAD-dependent protein deacylase [Proteiniclasticum sp.]|uniref:NAD-dependent protein deacylase n=1 Tax=Proteiniclasticum sp. TaxID=2053595 RepID=UPI0028993E0D|nr:NAD-dependent protein deacylase [Proteiniclasticum sp.]
MDKINAAAELIQNASKIVVLTGAGMSTESGLKDFRSKDGLGSLLYEGYYPEEILSHNFFSKYPDLFYNYIKEKLNVTGISPNKGHMILKEWEKDKDIFIITQNIDSLHQKAGSSNVLEIHGTLATCTCQKCYASSPLKQILQQGYECICGGIFKPDIVLYDEEVTYIREAFSLVKEADLLIVLGTSLKVYPAASIPEIYGVSHKAAIIINRDETPYAHHYSVVEINDGIGTTMDRINRMLKREKTV